MLKIGITEDDYRVAMIHEEFVNKVGGCEVVFKALNAKDTMQNLKEHPVDLLLLDIYMPDRLGTEAIDEIRSIDPQIGIIMISAGNDREIVQEALKKGIFDYIIKPVTLDRFVSAIEKFKQFKEEFSKHDEVDQTLLDQYFGQEGLSESHMKQDTPKGIDPLTLKKVKEILEKEKGLTAEEMGRQMGASRTTARRYLEYLISEGECQAELEYGIVGRPERKYYKS
ncbi:response regulator [Piscibacillus salipiscarius]|uniref:Response regulator n=1 Tax=Piscibacillus salipiscarius TaxID=299480 RepID=A0ABW5Q9P7_9BACI|nr:response regulator [Piscibacillus salipiscarius]